MDLINKILWRFNRKISKLYPRESIKFIKKHFKNKDSLIGAEIGVYTGGNAKSILKTLNVAKLYLIDPYADYQDYSGVTFNRAKKKAIKNIRKFSKKVKFIEKFSNEALNDIPQLDFIYIDGNHKYDYVKQDIENYWEKIKAGGIITGHDFNKTCLGVIKAVTEFCIKNNLKLYVENKDWWFIKN